MLIIITLLRNCTFLFYRYLVNHIGDETLTTERILKIDLQEYHYNSGIRYEWVNSPFFTNYTRCVSLVKYPVISHEREMNGIIILTVNINYICYSKKQLHI